MTPHPADRLSELADRAPSPDPRVLEALRREVLAHPEPKRSLSRLQRVCLSGLALAVGLVLTTFKSLPTEPHLLVLSASGLSIGAGALLFAGALPGTSRWDRRTRNALLAVLSVALFATLALEAKHFSTLGTFLSSETAAAAKCARHALLGGVIGASALMFLWKKTDPFSPGLSGALLGFLGGVGGTLSVEIRCASHEGLHLTLGHGLAAILVCLLGYFVGRKWLTP